MSAPNPQQPASQRSGRAAESSASAFSRLAILEKVREAIALNETTITEANLSIHAIQHGNRQFILERWEAGKRKRKTWIAEHGTWITELFPNNKKGTPPYQNDTATALSKFLHELLVHPQYLPDFSHSQRQFQRLQRPKVLVSVVSFFCVGAFRMPLECWRNTRN